jgi:hypothetical protein
MIDLDKDNNKPLPKSGLFRAFRSHPINSSHSLQLSSDDNNIDNNNNNNNNDNNRSNSSSINDINSRYRGYKQSFLRGHTKSIGLIEISEKEMLMITGKSNSIQNTVYCTKLN